MKPLLALTLAALAVVTWRLVMLELALYRALRVLEGGCLS